ncbi:MAG: Rrf2 family transcriptional regulator [Variovorax sp.]
MRLTTKGRVAVNAMIDLAVHRDKGPVALATIGKRQQVSISYLEHLFGNLRRQNLVASTRGPGGGYTLGRNALAITVADIVRAVDDRSNEALDARGDEPGDNGERCATPELWASLNHCVVEFLDSITLETLVDEGLRNGLWLADEQSAAKPARVPQNAPTGRRPANSVFALGN